MTRANKITYTLAVIFTAVFFIFSSFCGGVVFADTASALTYSNVLEDLKKDSNFSESYYPEKSDDNSLQVIHIAESVDNELFIYVYQPSGQAKNLNACSINISTTINENISFYNFKLQLCNSSGVFYKYVVKDFIVLSAPTRYYAITSIYRPFDENIDTPASDGNTITEVEFPVCKQYCFSTLNGQPYVSVLDIQTIEITDKFVGFVRYGNGFSLCTSACDSHFVAFNTDKPIDKLLEADVYYTTQKYTWQFVSLVGQKEEFGEKAENYAYLKYTDDKVVYKGNGLFAPTYKWDTIETVEQFISENDLTQTVYAGAVLDVKAASKITEEGKKALQDKKWVLRFAVTSYSLINGSGATTEKSTFVGDVSILRLAFETDGMTYNLGFIDNKQTGSNKPINKEDITISLTSKGKRLPLILGLIVLLILVVFFFPVVKPVLTVIVNGIVWLITAPFKALAKAIRRNEEE